MKIDKLLKLLKNTLNADVEQSGSSYLQQTHQQMQATIDRLAKTASLSLFKTDYLEG